MFGEGSPPVETPVLKDSKDVSPPKQLSRRDFLKGMAAATILAAGTGATVDSFVGASEKESNASEISKEAFLEQFAAMKEWIQRYVKDAENIHQIKSQHTQKRIREDFLLSFKDVLPGLVQASFVHQKAMVFYRLLSSVDCQGVVMAGVAAFGEKQDGTKESGTKLYNKMHDYLQSDKLTQTIMRNKVIGDQGKTALVQEDHTLYEIAHLRMHVSDYLPEDLFLDELDPRFGHALYIEQNREALDAYLQPEGDHYEGGKHLGWAAPDMQQKVRAVWKDKDVRVLLQNDQYDFTLKEAINIVKSVVRYQEHHPESAVQSVDIVKKLIEARKQFDMETFLSADIDHVVLISDDDPNHYGYSTYLQKFITEDIGMNPHNVTRVDALDPRYKNQPLSEVYFSTISDTSGSLRVFINAHGSKEGYIALRSGKEKLTAEDFAFALLMRLDNEFVRTGFITDSTLDQVTFAISSCHGYEFIEKIIDTMNNLYSEERSAEDGKTLQEKFGGKSLSAFGLPRIVTTSQEGSFSYGNPFVDTLESQKKGVLLDFHQGSNILSNTFFRRVQDEVGAYTDPVLFTGFEGEIAAIAATEGTNNSSSPV